MIHEKDMISRKGCTGKRFFRVVFSSLADSLDSPLASEFLAAYAGIWLIRKIFCWIPGFPIAKYFSIICNLKFTQQQQQ